MYCLRADACDGELSSDVTIKVALLVPTDQSVWDGGRIDNIYCLHIRLHARRTDNPGGLHIYSAGNATCIKHCPHQGRSSNIALFYQLYNQTWFEHQT